MDPARLAQRDKAGRCRTSMPLRQEKLGTMAGSIPARRGSCFGAKIYREKNAGARNAYPYQRAHHRIEKTDQEMRPETAPAVISWNGRVNRAYVLISALCSLNLRRRLSV